MDLTATSSSASPDAATLQRPAIAQTGRAQCSRCGAPLAADQRYCVECGNRLAEARPPLLRDRAALTAGLNPAPVAVVAAPAGGRGSSQIPLIAGVATLVLAMGVGVLIGKSGNDRTPVQAIVPQQNVAAALPAATTATTPTTPVDAAAADDTSAAAAKKKAKKVAADAAASGSTVISSDDKKPLPKKVSVGSKGSGKGYTDGEFTGDFFGQ